MEILPALDLANGCVVRLRQGRRDTATAYPDAPEVIAARWARAGFRRVHLVDLDGALHGHRVHDHELGRVASVEGIRVQAGGGLRSDVAVEAALDAGADRIVLGTRAVKEPHFVSRWIARIGPDRVVVALDVSLATGAPHVVTHGWTDDSTRDLWETAGTLVELGLRHVLTTSVGRDGELGGPELDLYRDAVARVPELAWQASGGVRDLDDLDALARTGVSAAIVGRAFLDGHIDPEEARRCHPDGSSPAST